LRKSASLNSRFIETNCLHADCIVIGENRIFAYDFLL
jgi:hypothetical protein